MRAPSGEAITLLKDTASQESFPSECLLWPFSISKDGYPRVQYERKQYTAHRLLMRLRGEDVEGKVVRHRCRNRHCFNPKHLETGTYKDNNVIDRVRDGTQLQGEKCGSSRLTEKQVREIYRLRREGNSLSKIADLKKVSRELVGQICRGKIWKHLKLHPLDDIYTGRRSCVIEGVSYPSIRAASKALNRSYGSVWYEVNK